MLWHDFLHAARMLRRSPGFTLTAVLILALGIGANTAIFSVVNGVLLSPLPYKNAERIIALGTRFNDSGRETPRLTGGDFVDLAAGTESFEAISYYAGGEMGVQVGEKAAFTSLFLVNPAFFDVFAVRPSFGRFFSDNPNDDRTAVVSARFAQRHFESPERAIGKRLSTEGKQYEIVGIAAGFHFPRNADVWAPAPVKPGNTNRTAYNYSAVARLRPALSLASAKAELATIGARLATAYPDSNKAKSFAANPLLEQISGGMRSTLLILMAAVALVLLTACANIANLLLARATVRSREMAVRAAIGASRWEIIRLSLAESTLLAITGALAGCVIAYVLIATIPSVAPGNMPRLDEIHVSGPVLLFAVATSMVASVLFGIVPALHASRSDLHSSLRAGVRATAGGSAVTRKALVISEIALAIVLAVGGVLLFRSFMELNRADLGFRTEGVLVMYAHAPARTDADLVAVTRRFEQLFASLKTIPGVTHAAGAMGLPAGQYGSNGFYAVEGKHEFRPGAKLPHAGFRLASPGYFSTMQVPLLRGREFTERDQYDAPFVAIVSDSLAKQTFPGEDPIGKRIMCGLDSVKWMTIVGVVGDVRQQSPASPPAPELYMPLHQHPSRANEIQVVLRTTVPPSSVVAAAQAQTEAMSAGVATKFTTMDAMVSDSIAIPRFRTFLIGGFALLSLALAVAGVYGVMAYMVAQRTSEMGVRMALGASTGSVMLLVLKHAAILTIVGIAIGVSLALAGSQVLGTMLFGLQPTDITTYLLVAGAIAAAMLAAAAVPAWRATRIDPITALRQD